MLAAVFLDTASFILLLSNGLLQVHYLSICVYFVLQNWTYAISNVENKVFTQLFSSAVCPHSLWYLQSYSISPMHDITCVFISEIDMN